MPKINFENNYFLGHHRLAFNDLSSEADQPFNITINGNTYTLLFNGEIYNYLQLKSEIEYSFGYKFRTNSDTEVLVAALHYYKDLAFSQFDGVWAFVLINHTMNTIKTSRDRLGEKPLYILSNDKFTAFSSEVKPLLDVYQEYQLNKKEILSTVVTGMPDTIGKNTCFVDIERHLASTTQEYTIKKHNIWLSRTWKYWSIESIKEQSNRSMRRSRKSCMRKLLHQLTIGYR